MPDGVPVFFVLGANGGIDPLLPPKPEGAIELGTLSVFVSPILGGKLWLPPCEDLSAATVEPPVPNDISPDT